jgi:hypothetical protein
METPAHLPFRQAAALAHALLAAWFVLAGVAHQIAVLSKARAGTLAAKADVPSLLSIGGGLLICGALLSMSLWPLMRAAQPTALPALGALGLAWLFLGAVARAHDPSFFGGTVLALGAASLVVGASALAAAAR